MKILSIRIESKAFETFKKSLTYTQKIAPIGRKTQSRRVHTRVLYGECGKKQKNFQKNFHKILKNKLNYFS
jgi:hypothetical protein